MSGEVTGRVSLKPRSVKIFEIQGQNPFEQQAVKIGYQISQDLTPILQNLTQISWVPKCIDQPIGIESEGNLGP